MSAEPNFNETEYELLSAYLDGELADEQRAALESRLVADAALRAELNALRTTVALIKGLPPLKAPRAFTLTAELLATSEPTAALPQPTLVQLTGEPTRQPRTNRRSRAPLVALAGVAAALLLVFGLLSLISSRVANILSDTTSALQGGAAGAPPQVANAPTATLGAAVLPIASSETPVMLFSATQPAANTIPLTAQPPQPENGMGGSGGVAASALTVTVAAQDGAQRSGETALAFATGTSAAGMAMDSAPVSTLARTPTAPPEADDGIAAMGAFVTVTPDQGVDLMQEAPAMTPTPAGAVPPGEPEAAIAAPVTDVAEAEADAQEQPSDSAAPAESSAEEVAPQTAIAQSAPTTSRTPQPTATLLLTATLTPASPATITPDAAGATAAILGIEPAFWIVLLIAALMAGIGIAFWFVGRRAR